MKDKKNVFYCSFVIVATTVMFMNFDVDATESNQSAVVSDLNLSNTAAADAIDMTVRGIATNNIDRLMSETILPVLANSSSSNIVANKNNHTTVGAAVADESSSINNTEVNSNGQSIKGMQIQNDPLAANIGSRNSTNSPAVIMMDPEQRSSEGGNRRAIADNGTILLQFQNPMDADIVNRLERIETIIQNYTMRNEISMASKSIEEANNQIKSELSAIKSSINSSSVLSAIAELDNTAKSIEEANNQIKSELSAIKSSGVWAGIISGALAAGIVSAVAIFVLTRLHGENRIKLSEMRLRR
ncbi:MAG TPA: hypothetical protein VFR94_17430 [Nitrososphaeraceae archaeon]|nr:hypothetical protein [Nitrososphaeraceae archaeon]